MGDRSAAPPTLLQQQAGDSAKKKQQKQAAGGAQAQAAGAAQSPQRPRPSTESDGGPQQQRQNVDAMPSGDGAQKPGEYKIPAPEVGAAAVQTPKQSRSQVNERKTAAAAGNSKASTGGRGGDTPQIPGQDETGHFVVQPGHMIDTSAPFTKGRYKIVKLLGSGTYGKVVLCEDAKYNGALVAVKLVRNTPHLYRIAALNEIKVCMALDPEPNADLTPRHAPHSTLHTLHIARRTSQHSAFDMLREGKREKREEK